MKKLYLICCMLLVAAFGYSQNTVDTTAPFKRYPVLPQFRLLQTDSVSILTKDNLKKKRSVLLILFNPECEHCKHETEEIIKHIDELKKVQIVMATMANHNLMKDFYAKYSLDHYKNIFVGQDFQYMLPSFYRVRSLPYLAMYDQKGRLLSTFEGSMKIEDLVNVFK